MLTEATSHLRQLVWRDGPGTIPLHIRAVLSDATTQRDAFDFASATTEELVGAVRNPSTHIPAIRAEAALYARYLQMVDSVARRYAAASSPTFSYEDAHQEAALLLIEIARDSQTQWDHVEGVLRSRVGDVAYKTLHTVAVPRCIVDRVRAALNARDYDPVAACEWAQSVPAAGNRVSRDVFWSCYAAVFEPVAAVDDYTEAVDHHSANAFEAVENLSVVDQILSWRELLTEKEWDVIERTFLYTTDVRDTDDRIALDHDTTRVDIVRTRKSAMAALAYEAEAEGLAELFGSPSTNTAAAAQPKRDDASPAQAPHHYDFPVTRVTDTSRLRVKTTAANGSTRWVSPPAPVAA